MHRQSGNVFINLGSLTWVRLLLEMLILEIFKKKHVALNKEVEQTSAGHKT